MLHRIIGIGGIGLMVALGPPAGRADAVPQEAGAAPVALCADCHDQAKGFGITVHGKAGANANSACESCHGNGTKHMEGGGDKALIAVPKGSAGAETCLSCHKLGSEHKSGRFGPHASSDTVSCVTCHSIHKPDPKSPKLLAKPQLELCGTCHPGPVRSHQDKPFAHKLGRGNMECASCHDPHGRDGRAMVKTERTGEPVCVTCHAEKRGPFVFEHVTGAFDTCMKCHEPHGSSNQKRLVRSSVDQLCLECHSGLASGAFGSQPPASHNLMLPRWKSCTTCHVAIHGSNRSQLLMK